MALTVRQTADLRWVRADEWLRADADGGSAAYRPTVVDLDTVTDASATDVAHAAAVLGARAGVAVGVTRAPARVPPRLLDALTLTLAPSDPAGRPVDRRIVASDDVDSALARIESAVLGNPHASTVLDQVLRTGAGLPVPDGLRVESFAYSTLLGGPEFAEWLDGRGPKSVAAPRDDLVLVERSGDTLRITLDHPARRNAFSAALRDALVDALDLAAADHSLRRVELWGNGPAFCSGGDLAEFGTATDPVRAHLVRTGRSAAARLAELSARVHVLLHGPCVGAGIELPSFAAHVVAAPDTRIRLPEIRMGLIPGAGGTVGIARRIGRWRTAYLALTGIAIGAQLALEWGLVDEIRAAEGS
ncbi:enoyl-CoA hydratase/isomerase family protein [Streptomyces sp. NPDC058001]|uniref:enoyl-CoA hydratase/isomerase family protein n=1 Tax=Streptomyces sp. NPDC058001 TaxID=3346300 RepID=UPI0036E77B42